MIIMSFLQKNISVILLGVLMIIIMIITSTGAAPRPGAEWDRNNNPCIYDDLKVEVCQRCAKQTKSPIVYPMCCNSEDQVYEWCDKYIHFGRQP